MNLNPCEFDYLLRFFKARILMHKRAVAEATDRDDEDALFARLNEAILLTNRLEEVLYPTCPACGDECELKKSRDAAE